MNKYGKEIIKKTLIQQENNINNNKFDTLYNIFLQIDEEEQDNTEYYFTPEFTKIFLSAGINPLVHMNKVPEDFLRDSDITSFTIPDNIEIIEAYAFAYCENLRNIKLPKNLRRIEEGVFIGCDELKQITLPKSIESIGEVAFRDCGLEKVIYEGTMEEFNNIYIRINNYSIYNSIIECTNGILKGTDGTFVEVK